MEHTTELEKILHKIGRNFSVKFEPLAIDGQTFDILAVENMPAYLDKLVAGGSIADPLRDLPLWAKVWPASFVLAKALKTIDTKDKTLLELGAGMGVCSIMASYYDLKKITVSDSSEDALDFARANVLKNNLSSLIDIRSLDLSSPGPDPRFAGTTDIIMASELLYLDNLHRPLLKFISRALAPGGKALLCQDLSRAKPRFKKLAEKSFKVREGRTAVKSVDENKEEERRIYSVLILEK
ncbi:MAG: methyltransferase [Desulfovibrio sp.]|nr:methyltransferase [Desulfovibrio sp.]